jgi:hypothetical protein
MFRSVVKSKKAALAKAEVDETVATVAAVIEVARYVAARSVNSIMTATYWEIGRRIVEGEQRGSRRAEYGEQLLLDLSERLTARFGRGFSARNLRLMRAFYLDRPEIWQTPSANFTATAGTEIWQTPSARRASASR